MAERFAQAFIDGDPGAIVTGVIRDFCRSWRNQEEVRVKGLHFLQEDSPTEISEATATWLQRLPNRETCGF